MGARAYKTELDPNGAQVTAFLKHAGTARYAYNWGLSRQKAEHETTEKRLSVYDLQKVWVRERPEWAAEVSAHVVRSAFANLDRAYQNFFRRLKNGEKPGFPKFKSKKRGIGSFRLYGSVHVRGRYVQLPRIGLVRLKEHGYLPEDGVKIVSATISETAGRWFVSLAVEQETAEPEARTEPVIGVDLGVKVLATCSDGVVYENPRPLKMTQRKVKRLQRAVSRRQKGSQNRKKAVRRLARAHYRVACVRRNAIHQATTAITKRAGTVVLEDLNVRGMLKNRCLAGAIGDSGFGEFRRQVEYKQAWTGGQVVIADRWLPSSKTCSCCGAVKEKLKLSERTFRCEACGFTADRDLNAAVNLRNVAVRATETVNACEGERFRVRPVLPSEAGILSTSVCGGSV